MSDAKILLLDACRNWPSDVDVRQWFLDPNRSKNLFVTGTRHVLEAGVIYDVARRANRCAVDMYDGDDVVFSDYALVAYCGCNSLELSDKLRRGFHDVIERLVEQIPSIACEFLLSAPEQRVSESCGTILVGARP